MLRPQKRSSPATGGVVPKNRKGLGYSYSVAMICIAQYSTPQRSKKDDDEDAPSDEEGETVLPGKEPPESEEEGQVTLDELQEVNLGSDEGPHPPSSVGVCPQKKKNYTSNS